MGDPLERAPEAVLEDVIDGYVSIARAEKDYGVVIREIDKELDQYEIDYEATEKAREYIRSHRKQWLQEDVDKVLDMYRRGEIDQLDLIRRYGVIIDMHTDQVLRKTTQQFREMLQKRAAAYWN